jgi:hypothetical protein
MFKLFFSKFLEFYFLLRFSTSETVYWVNLAPICMVNLQALFGQQSPFLFFIFLVSPPLMNGIIWNCVQCTYEGLAAYH